MESKGIQVPKDTMILGRDAYYSLDTYATGRNNNVVVIGSPGSGKTRSIISPNLLQATGSYVVTDPKGNLYDKYRLYLRRKGYITRRIDFTGSKKSAKYNPILKAETEDEIAELAHTIIFSNHGMIAKDPYWDEAAETLLNALLSYLLIDCKREKCTFSSVMELIGMAGNDENDVGVASDLDLLFNNLGLREPNCSAVRNYKSFRQNAGKTRLCILNVLSTTVSRYAAQTIEDILQGDDINIPEIGQRKTAIFITVSDTDRHLDGLINIVFTQIMQGLVKYADSCPNSHLPVPVRFLMDDFATNVTISQFPSLIACIRSRWISAVIILQTESQLLERYEEDGRTILGCCDTYVYLGGGDIDTAEHVARRADRALKSIMEMPLGSGLIFRRGEKARECKTFPLEEFEKQQFYDAHVSYNKKTENNYDTTKG